MREARWSRAKVDAENRRTGGNIFRAAISSARNERTSRLWPVEHSAAPGQARAAPVEHSAAPGQTRAAPVEHSAAPGATSSGTFRVICGSGAGSSDRFEPVAALGRARAAISSHLRLRAKLERPNAANSGISSQAGHESPSGPGAPDPEETL